MMKIHEFLVSDFPVYDSCAEPDKIQRIDFKVFMKVKMQKKEMQPVLNQKPNDIIKKSYREEKRLEEWLKKERWNG